MVILARLSTDPNVSGDRVTFGGLCESCRPFGIIKCALRAFRHIDFRSGIETHPCTMSFMLHAQLIRLNSLWGCNNAVWPLRVAVVSQLRGARTRAHKIDSIVDKLRGHRRRLRSAYSIHTFTHLPSQINTSGMVAKQLHRMQWGADAVSSGECGQM